MLTGASVSHSPARACLTFTPLPLLESQQTCLDEQELLGLGAHLVGCCAVVAAKVALGVGSDLTGRKDQEKTHDRSWT